LQDCILDIDDVVTAPLRVSSPDQSWADARNSGAIPPPLFALYCRADYLSFGSAPGFLADPQNILFSYFAMLLRSLKDLLGEAQELVVEFAKEQGQTYDPVKKARGESWDPTATRRARRAFKYLMVSLSGTLDSLADLVALFFTGRIPRLRLGRAQFSQLEAWLRRPLVSSGLIVTPHEHHLRVLHDALRPLVLADAPERDRLPLMRLFRNKAAHMGDHMFQYTGLHDEHGRFYTFLPRQWPYISEKYLAPADPNRPADPAEHRTLFERTLTHEDIISYTRGLRSKVGAVVSSTVDVIATVYEQFRNFPVNEAALAELEGSSEAYDFQYFDDPP
jgi:hypothetical protein